MNARIVGSPKWYFDVTEYWRRVYIQWWDKPNNSIVENEIAEKKGLKYDASYRYHTKGPYREGKKQFFYMTNPTRTLPIEYWHEDSKVIRDHYVRTESDGYHVWNSVDIDLSASVLIPDENPVGADNGGPHGTGTAIWNKERNYGLPDKEFIYPSLEYQRVNHLTGERLPGWENRDVDDENFGDGFNIEISFPFKVDGEIQSPFSIDGIVQPPGIYCHGFDTKFPERVMKYPAYDTVFPDEERDFWDEHNLVYREADYLIPDELKGEKVTWHVPSHMEEHIDGIWVEQCLGGVVTAKALVTIEDNFGGRRDVWVSKQQFVVTDKFEGKDQGEPVEPI
jgi:hypothetical protein